MILEIFFIIIITLHTRGGNSDSENKGDRASRGKNSRYRVSATRHKPAPSVCLIVEELSVRVSYTHLH